MEPICCEERKPRKKMRCGDLVLEILFVLFAATIGIIIGALTAATILGALAAVIVLAVVLAILIIIRIILNICNKKMQC